MNFSASSPTTGTLTDAILPVASFHSDEFPVELSQTSLAEADEILRATLEEAKLVVGGTRAFLALVDMASGELVLRFTTGEGWTDEIRRQRVNVQHAAQRAAAVRGAASRGTSWSTTSPIGRAMFWPTRTTSAFSTT